MTVRTSIVDNLPTSLFALIGGGASFGVVANNVYFDTRTRYKREQIEVVCTWAGRRTSNVIPGRLISSIVNIELFLATPDLVVDKTLRLEDKLERTTRTIVENYDNEEALAATLCGARVDYVRCAEAGAFDIEVPDDTDPRFRYIQNITLEIAAWES